MRLILLFVFGAGSFGIFPGQTARMKPGAQPLSIKISGPASEVPVGDPVNVKIRLTNTSSHDVNGSSTYNDGGVDLSYQYDVHRDSGEPMRPIYKRDGRPETSSTMLRTLKPGESVEGGTDIGGLYDLGPGKYTIQLSRRVSLNPQEGVVKSNTIKLTVIPPIPPPFTIEISTPTPEVKAGSAVSLRVKLTNTSTRELVLGVSPPTRAVNTNYMHWCFGEMGSTGSIKNVANSYPVGPGDDPLITLKPGEVRDEQEAITSACDLSQPGRYRIQLIRPVPNDPYHHSVKSNEITIRVKP